MYTHGGKRKNSGRKTIDDPKKPVTVYVKKSSIKKHGGLKKTKEKALLALEN